jgi:hypothetical protein
VDEIQFELRQRRRIKEQFWSVHFDTETGFIKSIQPGQINSPEHITLSYARVKDLLAGDANQNDFRVMFNETLGTLDLVDIKKPTKFKKKHNWKGWLSAAENQGDLISPIRILMFNENGMLRTETSRQWSTEMKERLDKDLSTEKIPLFISDEEDPHQLLGKTEISVADIVDRGFWEQRLWSFMRHDTVVKILYQGQRVRINLPPVAEDMTFNRVANYHQYSGVSDEQTVISHDGEGKHVSIFLKDNGVWAQSHYEKGSSIDSIFGNIKVAILNGNDPDNFYTWGELPALMLRQSHPFEILAEWPYQTPPQVLYKANNIDIGVLN